MAYMYVIVHLWTTQYMLYCIMFKPDAQPTEDLESQPLEMDVSILAPNQSPTVSCQTLVLLF